MFQFPGLASFDNTARTVLGCPIRKSADHSLFATSRSLSQLITSFIASESLGIHHTLLLTFLALSSLSYYFTLELSSNMSKNFIPLSRKSRLHPDSNQIHTIVTNYPEFHTLSLTPHSHSHPNSHPVVENNGFEPLTPCVQSRCSSQLS